jgi:hypothetical protein
MPSWKPKFNLELSIVYKTLSGAILTIAIFYNQWQQPEYIENNGSYENNNRHLVKEL